MANLKKKSVDKTAFKHSKVDELFNLIKNPNTGNVIICVGNYKVSRKQFKTFKEADEYIRQRPYEILINVAVLMNKLTQDENKDNNETAKQEPANNQ